MGGHELLTLHADRFITWRLDRTNKLASDNIVMEHAFGSDGAWGIYKDFGDLDTIAVCNR